jgi:pilus assembly protein Flp/PilA
MSGSFVELARRFHADECGATAIEYALIAAGIGAAIAGTVFNMGTTLKGVWWDKFGGIL